MRRARADGTRCGRRPDVDAVSIRALDGGSERRARAIVETALAGDQHDRSRSQSGERAFRCRSKSRVELRVAAAVLLSVDEAQISQNLQKRRDTHD